MVSTLPGEADLCMNDPSRKLVRQIMGAIAEYDKAMIVAKLAAARKRIRDSGRRCDGRVPYGLDPRHPEEAAVVADVRRQRASGLCPLAIARALNDAGVRTRYGKRWHSDVIARLLARTA